MADDKGKSPKESCGEFSEQGGFFLCRCGRRNEIHVIENPYPIGNGRGPERIILKGDMMPDEKPKKKTCGALWLKKSRQDQDYFTGNCVCEKCGCKQEVVVFENLRKTSEKAPDWVMWPDDKQKQQRGGQ